MKRISIVVAFCLVSSLLYAQSESTIDDAIVPSDVSPPIGITLILGWIGDVSEEQVEDYVAQTVAPASNWMWKITHGQIYVHKLIVLRNIDLNSSTQMSQIDGIISHEDVTGFYAVNKNEGWVSWGMGDGRHNRLMGVHRDPGDFDVLLHELAHLIFTPSYFVGGLLEDEYLYAASDGTPSPAPFGLPGQQLDPCIMDIGFSPRGLCWTSGTHTHKNRDGMVAGDKSCWEGLLAAYPLFDAAIVADPLPTTNPPALQLQIDGGVPETVTAAVPASESSGRKSSSGGGCSASGAGRRASFMLPLALLLILAAGAYRAKREVGSTERPLVPETTTGGMEDPAIQEKESFSSPLTEQEFRYRVTTFEGQPVPRARVTLLREAGRCSRTGGRQSVAADRDGWVRVPWRPGVVDLVRLEADGLPRTTLSGTNIVDRLVFAEAGYLEGHVDVLGAHGSNVIVTATVSKFGRADRHILSGNCDVAGQYRIGPVAVGSIVQIRAEAAGFLPSINTARALQYRLQRSDFTLEKGGVISGQVVGETGDPIAGARIRSVQGEARQSAKSTAEGRFRLAGLEEESAMLIVQAPGYRMKMISNVRPGMNPLLKLERRRPEKR